jgi:hypothetical protein
LRSLLKFAVWNIDVGNVVLRVTPENANPDPGEDRGECGVWLWFKKPHTLTNQDSSYGASGSVSPALSLQEISGHRARKLRTVYGNE